MSHNLSTYTRDDVMRKPVVVIAAVVVIVAAAGVGGYFVFHKNNNLTTQASTGTTSSSVQTLQGNALITSVFTKLEAQVPTVTDFYLTDQTNDGNNLIGKKGEYVYAGHFFDSRTNYTPQDANYNTVAAKDDHTGSSAYGTDAGGTIEIFANNTNAKARGAYLEAMNSSAGPLGGGDQRVVGNVVLRVASGYTATQQTQMLDLMQKDLEP